MLGRKILARSHYTSSSITYTAVVVLELGTHNSNCTTTVVKHAKTLPDPRISNARALLAELQYPLHRIRLRAGHQDCWLSWAFTPIAIQSPMPRDTNEYNVNYVL